MKTWTSLPSFSPTILNPILITSLSKECFVYGHGSHVYANFGNFPKKGEFVILDCLTRKRRKLLPLFYSKSQALVNSTTKSYALEVIGHSIVSNKHLSRKIEVFESQTSKLEEAFHFFGPLFKAK